MTDWDLCTVTAPNGEKIATLTCIPIIFGRLLYWAFFFSGIVALAFIVYAGYKYIRSSGDAKQAEEAQKTLTYAIIGLIVVFASLFIINIISGVTAVNCIKSFGFDCTP